MKKTIVLLLCSLSITSLAACGNLEKPNVTEPSSEVQIRNPFVNCETLDEAITISGFDMTVPETINGYSERTIQAVKDDMIQVLYLNGDEKICIRKADRSGDISGNYNEYKEVNSISVGDVEVTTKGDSGIISVATWTADGYTFAINISNKGMTVETISTLIAEVR